MTDNKKPLVTVKGLRTLSKLTTGSGGRLRPAIYEQTVVNPNADGNFVENFEDRPFLRSKRHLTPVWNTLGHAWFFDGTPEALGVLINRMQLRYPKEHERKGQVISNEHANPEDRLRDRYDPVFNHRKFFTEFSLNEGRMTLDPNEPSHEFMSLCLSADKNVANKSKAGRKNYGNPAFELNTVGAINKSKKDDVEEMARAMELLTKMKDDLDRMVGVMDIMKVPGYNPKVTELNGAYMLLFAQCVQNSEMVSRFGTTWRKRFIQVAEMSHSDFVFERTVRRGIMKGHLRERGGYYSLLGERLDLTSERELFEFFKNPANSSKFIELEDKLREE